MIEDGIPDEVCVHRWALATPSGDQTPGVCSRCGATRSFTGANKSRPASTWRKHPPAEGAKQP